MIVCRKHHSVIVYVILTANVERLQYVTPYW